MERITLLGSTGSIGEQTLDIVRRYPERFKITSLVAHSRWQQLAAQAREFGAESVVIGDERYYDLLKRELNGTDIEVLCGSEAINHVASSYRSDTIVNALVGYAGLHPTALAIESGKRIALANKETLVVGGDIIMSAARRKGVEIVPIDSEHSAIMQCLEGEQRKSIRNLIITCSGGALRNISREELGMVTPEVALKHPQWTMGAKITIDSSTLVNKGFEVIEAHWLFGTPADKIDVVMHPESIIHSMVEYSDGSVIAHMGHPDMREPIGFALSFPERLTVGNRKIDFSTLGNLSFEAPDLKRFPCLELAYESIRRGGNAPCALNAANEVAVAAYLKGLIGFYDIAKINERCLAGMNFVANPGLDDIFETNKEVAIIADGYIN